MSNSKTSLALDNLRGYAILIVVSFHSVIAYIASQPATQPPFDQPPYTWMAYPIIDSARWLGFDLFCAFQYVYMMHLMFLLSGLFVWPSLQRKGARAFLYDRLLRLGVPFLVGVYLLMPVTYYAVYRVTTVDPSWSAFWSSLNSLTHWPAGPMWFLSSLLALNIIAAALFWLFPRTGEWLAGLSGRADTRPVRFCLVLAGVTALVYVPLSAVFKPWQWLGFGPFNFQPSLLPQYAIYFFAGLGIGAYGFDRGLLAPDGALVRRWGAWAAAAPAAFLLWIIPTALIVQTTGAPLPGLQVVADLGFVLASATICLALLAVFLRFAAVHQPILHGLSENAYGIYFIHYLFVVWLQYLLLGVALPAVLKAAIVFTVTLVLSWATTVAFCSLPMVAHLLRGRRRVAARAPSPASGRYSKAEASE
jgi:peptidoglycan/LPS O-acetylase OafA/YrhL